MARNENADIIQHELSDALLAIDKTVLELIGGGAPFPDVLNALSRVIEEQSPGLLCSFLLLSPDGKILGHCAAPSLPSSYIRAIDGMAIGPCAGSCGTAAYRGEPVIVSDIASDPLWAEYRELGLSHGLRACWSTPIVSRDGKVLGTFATYCREPRSPSQHDWRVIERAAHLAAIAIERGRTEAALRQERAMLDAVLGHLPDQIYFKDRDSRFTRINDAMVAWFGLSDAKQVLGKTDSDFFTSEHAQQAFADEQEIMRSGQPLSGKEEKETWPDGRETWVLTTKMPLRDPQGQIVGTMGISRDITERKRAEEALRASEERYRLLFEQNLAGVYRAALGGHLLDCNKSFARMLGYESSEELMAHGPLDVYWNPADREALIQRLKKQHALTDVESCLRRKDASPLWVLENASVIEDVDGSPASIQGTLIDITERKQLEEQLRQSQKMEAVGRLAGGVAHDFNNLLMVIKGHSDLIVNRVGPGPLRKNAQNIGKAADRAAALTQQLLAFSRRQVLQPKVLDLNAVVAETGKMLRRLIGDDIELVIVPGASLRGVKADQSQIEQVILNLAVNGRDAMPQGGKLIIETANVSLDDAYGQRHAGVRPGRYVMLAVTDTGTGLDVETQAHIFEPFFTTKQPGKGTGLGLAMVHGVVKQSGGWIWVYSELGKGTTFKIYLPQVEEVVMPVAPSKAVTASPRGSETILLVEDQEGVRELAREFLESRGYRVLEAPDGAEALQTAEAQQDPIDLLVTDVVMPKMNGPELSRRLTTLLPRLKVIYMSGYAECSPWNHEIAQGDAMYLQKPVALDVLARKVREVLDAERGFVVPPTKGS